MSVRHLARVSSFLITSLVAKILLSKLLSHLLSLLDGFGDDVTEAAFLHNGHIGLGIKGRWYEFSPEGLQPLPEAVRAVY